MLNEYYWEVIEEDRPVILRIVAVSKEVSKEKLKEFGKSDGKLLEIREIKP
jgi:hypothetical protein